jgi:hypothetical protein
MFMDLQEKMISDCLVTSKDITHPGSKGDASEDQWKDWLGEYLPKRYQVEKAFVVDSQGNISEQLDAVVFDRQYSPFLLSHHGQKYIPAESVYAVFEVKQSMNKEHIEYAGNKIMTVRKLHRTSVKISHAGGEFSPKPPIPILGGILALHSEWNPPFGEAFNNAIDNLSINSRIDVGCCLREGGFEVSYDKITGTKLSIEISEAKTSLVFFFLRMLRRLQEVGTVPAMDLIEYEKSIKNK